MKITAFFLYFLAFIFTAILTFMICKNHLGTLSSSAPHQWLTASTVNFVENWESDGFLNDKAMMLELPKSIENSTFESRKPYVSYLPGAALEITLVKKIFPSSSTLVLTQIFNLCNQFLISLVLAFILFYGSSSLPGLYRYLMALAVFITWQSLPAVIYVHSMVFFSDQAVLLPFCLALLMELIIRKRAAMPAYLLQSFILSWATLCDWLAIPLIASILAFRFLSPLKNRRLFDSAQLMLLPACILIFFALQLYHTHLWQLLMQRFSLRSGLYDASDWFLIHFIRGFFVASLGMVNFMILLGSMIYIYYLFFKKSEKMPELVVVSAIAMSACIMHAFILTNHTLVHATFSIVKFYFLMTLLAIGVIPILLINAYKSISLAIPVMIFAAWYHFITIPESHAKTLLAFNSYVNYQEIAFWLEKHSGFSDVFISKQISIQANPPQAIALSKKSVHTFASLDELRRFYSSIPKHANYYAILDRNEFNQCGITNPMIKNRIYSNKNEWIIFKFIPGNDKIDKCLVKQIQGRVSACRMNTAIN